MRCTAPPRSSDLRSARTSLGLLLFRCRGVIIRFRHLFYRGRRRMIDPFTRIRHPADHLIFGITRAVSPFGAGSAGQREDRMVMRVAWPTRNFLQKVIEQRLSTLGSLIVRHFKARIVCQYQIKPDLFLPGMLTTRLNGGLWLAISHHRLAGLLPVYP